jgi:ankyrin repeat protein
MLRHCLAPSLRRQLNELPISLDETYERVLKEIESTNQGRHARRLLHCLAVALRPLDVEELAEVLAFDLDATDGELPRFHPEWRWEEQEQAVLSACSSLISIVDQKGSRVVQFSHFSVKEYLTSNRLAVANGDLEVSRYHILPEPAHLILAHACLGVLLCLDNRVDKGSEEGGGMDSHKDISLLQYAAEHWASHALIGNVSSRLKVAMETLFDLKKPYFVAWIRTHDIDPATLRYPHYPSADNPLYYAALCGFHDLVRRLIVKHPEQVNQNGGNHNSPLVAALSRNHVRVAELLLEHGAHIHVRGDPPLCRAITFSDDARVNAVQFLLRYGADVNTGQENLLTPLHLAADVGSPEVVRILLEHGADVDLRDEKGRIPLHLVSMRIVDEDEGERSTAARYLVERCADVNARDMDGATPLHFASCHGRLEIVRLLLDNGANVHAENIQGQNPLHELSRGAEISVFDYSSGKFNGIHLQNVLSVAQLLLEHGVDVNALDKDNATPLHLASSHGMPEIARLLLDHGAKTNVENLLGQTPLHVVSQSRGFSYETPDVARLLLEFGVDVNAQDKDQATPLHFACSHGNFETALVLLDHGAKVNAQNADGQTPLHRVSQSSNHPREDNPRVAQVMLERGADVNARDKGQATPLHLASYTSKPQTARVLLDHGAEADAQNAEGQTPLHRVSQGSYDPDNDDSRVARLLLECSVDANARDKNEATPLHLASYYGYANVAKVLLDHGARADADDLRGQTPLHQVILGTHNCQSLTGSWFRKRHLNRALRLAKQLLERGADPNAQNKDQETPLHLASRLRLDEMAQFLLEHGADVHLM